MACSQEQAIAYRSSTKYCRKCHMGDHESFTQDYVWSYEWDETEHTTCKWDATDKLPSGAQVGERALCDKGKAGDTVFGGKPRPGRGKQATCKQVCWPMEWLLRNCIPGCWPVCWPSDVCVCECAGQWCGDCEVACQCAGQCAGHLTSASASVLAKCVVIAKLMASVLAI